MKVSQQEHSPIGDYFHDSGVHTIFNALESTVDNFEVDTDQLDAWCGMIIKSIKGLQGLISKIEKEETKKMHEDAANEMIHRGVE